MAPFWPFVQFRCPSPQSTMNRDRRSPGRNLRGSRSFRPCSSREIPSQITLRVPSLVPAVHQSPVTGHQSRVFTPFVFGRMLKQRFCGSTGAPTPALSTICALFSALVALFSIAVLYFQQLAHSLCKTPGWRTFGTSSLLSPPARKFNFARPLFSWCYELFFPQLICFQNHLRCPRGVGCKPFLFTPAGVILFPRIAVRNA